MVAEGDKSLILRVFRELFSSRMLIVGVCCICLWFLTDPFVSLWLGSEYVLGHTTLALLIAQFFVSNTRNIVDDYLNAYGLFRDIWSPLTEAAINVALSVWLGSRYGLNGVLAGVLVSQLIITFSWKPFFLFRSALEEPLSFYISLYARCFLPGVVAFLVTWLILPLVPVNPTASLWAFLLYALVVGLVALGVYTGVLFLTEDSLKGFIRRIFRAVSLG